MAFRADDTPLPLSELRERMSPKTFAWLQAEDAKETRSEQAELLETAVADLFHHNGEEGQEEYYVRIQEWSSSSSNPDGFGGYEADIEEPAAAVREAEAEPVKVKYILSSASGGHGNELWAASRHISNLFADTEKCRRLLAPLLSRRAKSEASAQQHPLVGVKFLELGAGGGVPSWTAMRLGAKVVCTDLAIAKRIRCMAEAAELNKREMEKTLPKDDAKLEYASAARVCPYAWGSPVEDVLNTSESSSDSKIDVVVAADCIYNPEFHSALVDSIKMLMSDKGVALLPFALHGNTDDEKVWDIKQVAQRKGFQVEVLESQQLRPQTRTMDSKRGLVHTLRLTLT